MGIQHTNTHTHTYTDRHTPRHTPTHLHTHTHQLAVFHGDFASCHFACPESSRTRGATCRGCHTHGRCHGNTYPVDASRPHVRSVHPGTRDALVELAQLQIEHSQSMVAHTTIHRRGGRVRVAPPAAQSRPICQLVPSPRPETVFHTHKYVVHAFSCGHMFVKAFQGHDSQNLSVPLLPPLAQEENVRVCVCM